LNLVQLLSAGAEMWVGRLPEGVRLSDCQGAHGGVTAEWVLAAILAVLREVPVFVRAQDEERWDQHVTDTLTGKRVLLVGAGDLADQTARRLDPFDVASVTRVGRRAREGVHATSELPELLGEADVVVLLVPLTDETRGLVDAAFLAAMPDGALLVNAARGPVVDTDALLAELSAERLRAVVDVVDPEPLPADHPLWRAPNLLITPHVGGSVPGHLERAYGVVHTQLEAVARGEDPPNLVVDGY
jgi:phosphoglycerate dehydrogenase-like enzyme